MDKILQDNAQAEFKILKPQEAADRLRCSAALVYKLSQLGHLPSVRIGRKIGILESDLIKFVELNRYPQPRALTHARR
ncbi:MAG: helix-turn-helix domain-containing protein [Anaerolineae bacterium]|nr:helix-turn-helix domain-containing protein [Anaerolineae bacterium]